MSTIHNKAVGTRLRGMMHTVVGHITTALLGPAGHGTTLPTRAQLTKMGPKQEFVRRTGLRNGR